MHSIFVFTQAIRYLFKVTRSAVVFLCFVPSLVFGQDFDLVTQQKLNPQEAQDLRQLLQQPIPEGLSKQAANQWFLTRDSAAFRLGAPSERERILRLWLATSPNIDAKWTLGSYLMENSSKPEEGFALMEEVLQEQKHPVHMVRVRSRLAKGYLEEHNLKKALEWCDVANMLRIQLERQDIKYFPSLREYTILYGLDKKLLDSLSKEITVMHPGPINRGVEITSDVADSKQSVILEQVENGVAVRMAVLYLLAAKIG